MLNAKRKRKPMPILPVPNRTTLRLTDSPNIKPSSKPSKKPEKVSSKDLTKPSFAVRMATIKSNIAESTANFDRRTKMPIAEIKEFPKKRQGERKSKYPFTPQEVKQAAKLLKSQGQAGAGPYPSDGKPLRAARSAAQRLKNLVAAELDVDPTTISSVGWADEDGQEWAGIRFRNQS